MRVDFYQLGGGTAAAEKVLAGLAQKLLSSDERLLVVAEDKRHLARLDRLMWDEGATSFIPHGIAGGAEDVRQPVLLSTTTDGPNRARNILIADGIWRDAALGFDRAFFLFDAARIEDARAAWRGLAGREGVERRYWAAEDGKWVEKG